MAVVVVAVEVVLAGYNVTLGPFRMARLLLAVNLDRKGERGRPRLCIRRAAHLTTAFSLKRACLVVVPITLRHRDMFLRRQSRTDRPSNSQQSSPSVLCESRTTSPVSPS